MQTLKAKKVQAYSIDAHIAQAYIQKEEQLIKDVVSEYLGRDLRYNERKKIKKIFANGIITLYYNETPLGTIERSGEDYSVNFTPTIH